MLTLYGKNNSNVMCLIGDNCSVNQSIARTMDVPLIGCASHKFNLAVRKWMEGQPQLTAIIAKVRNCVFASYSFIFHLLTSLMLAFIQVAAVMKKAATLKVAAKLKKLTKLAVVKEKATR